MTIRTRTTTAAVVSSLAVTLVAAALPAQAGRWKFHDASVGEAMVAPPGATRAATCTHRLRAVAGYGSFVDVEGGEDPGAFPLPPDASNAVAYRVWKAPAGFDSFASAFQDFDTGQVIFLDPDGVTEHPATLVGSVTTPPRQPLETPRPAGGERGVSDNYVFTTAPISVALTGVRPGDLLGLAPQGEAGGIFVEARAIDCGLPVVGARVDLRPGTRDDVVRPHEPTDLVPVRVFGSRRLSVRHVATIRLGEAVSVSAQRPRDADHDGRADRVYVFAQGDTDIQCVDTGVRVTGRTTDRVRFDGRTPIVTTGCAG